MHVKTEGKETEREKSGRELICPAISPWAFVLEMTIYHYTLYYTEPAPWLLTDH